MPDELPVHVSRTELHGLEVPATFETHGSFDVQLVNHGESLHLHLHIDDSLSTAAAIDAGNHYVEGDSARTVRVAVDEDELGPEPIRGKLKVASAYGAQTRWIDVVLSEPEDGGDEVRVDESLARPSPRPESDGDGLLDATDLPVLGLGVLALAVAIGVALVVQTTLVVVGAVLVLAGVLAAALILWNG